MRPAVTRPLLALAVIAVVAAACAGAGGTPSAPPDAAAGSAPQGSAEPAGGGVWLPDWAANVPPEVAGRRQLPFCGVEQAPAPQPGMFIDRAVRLCFWNAHLGHTEAEFASVQTTIEGAPIATIYRLAADGSVEVLTDFTQDNFGPGTWTVSTCANVVEGEGDELLGVATCDEGRPLP